MDEKVKINLSEKQKKIIIIVSVIAVVLVGVIVSISLFKTAISTRVMYSLMPESIVSDEGDYEFFVEYNKDFNPIKDRKNPMLAFSYYYKDKDGNTVDLGPDGKFVDEEGNETPLSVPFLYKMAESDRTVKAIKTVKAIIAVIVILVIIGLIFLWFIIWSKKEDREKEQKYSNKNNNNKKK